MSSGSVIDFPLLRLQVDKPPTLADAYAANIELIELQAALVMPQTIEERMNRLRRAQGCLEVISAYILTAYQFQGRPH